MRNIAAIVLTIMLLWSMAACSLGSLQSVQTVDVAQNSETIPSEAVLIATEDNVQSEGSTFETGASVTATAAGATVSQVLAQNSQNHDEAEDYIWDPTQIIPITLSGNSINADAEGVTVNGSIATINAAGTYSLSGSLTEGQIVIDSPGEGIVRLILNGVDIHNSTSAAINIVQADEAMIVLADNTENLLSDGDTYVFESTDTDEPNAALFSAADLTITGGGSLIVNGNYNDGIASKDGLILNSGMLTVSAADDGVRGKDYLITNEAAIYVTAQGDGLKSDNAEDAADGYVSIESGIINITSGGDAIAAETDVIISGGEITLVSGGGSDSAIDETASAKGIKGTVSVVIDGGTLTIDAADDALHSNGSVTIEGGTFSILTGDDGIHADSTLEINGGDILISESFEGLESAVITINAGKIQVIARDDGINVAGGVDGSGTWPGGMGPGGMAPGQETFTYTGDYYLYINGGYLAVNAAGDGIDVNGAIEMTDGIVLVNGPVEHMNAALDYDANFVINGGFFVAAGSAGMAQAPGEMSGQNSMLLNFDTMLSAGTIISILDDQGNAILTFEPSKDYQSVAFSSPAITTGSTYTIYTGGSSSGSMTGGLFQDGVYSPGAQVTSLTISSAVTRYGSGGWGGGPGGGRRP